VVANSGADAAGLQGEDVIVALGGQDIRNTGDLSKFLLENLPGKEVAVRIYRGNSEIETKATLGERPLP
jgi:S1-C subfamily serine protease